MAVILLVDNYDSFTYNLSQMVQGMGCEVKVARNDKIGPGEVTRLRPGAVMLSPGPGRPEDAGSMMEVIAESVEARVPSLGVCLGMQGLGAHFGAKVVHAETLMHGKTCVISHDGEGVFRGVGENPVVMRYHSLVLEGLPDGAFVESARSDDGELMAFRHRELPVEAVQFHPESFATPDGPAMVRNLLEAHGVI